MIPTASVDSRSVRNSHASFFVKFASRSAERLKNVIIVINYSAKDASKIGYNSTRIALVVTRI